MTTVKAGRRGEAAVASAFVRDGYDIYMPTFGNAVCDMIVCKDNEMLRVEVKCTSAITSSGKYEVSLRSVRPNRTTSVVHKFDSSKSDVLAVFVEPENRVALFKSKELEGRSTLTI